MIDVSLSQMCPAKMSYIVKRLFSVFVIMFSIGSIASKTVADERSNKDERPNILFIFSDDHAVNSISAYGGSLAKVAPSPNIDRIAREGILFQNSFCANSICGPSRACILTGKHSHKNGFMRNSRKPFDQSQWTVAKSLQSAGYQTAVIGKWHLKSDPVAFDYWEVFPGQGSYYNPVFLQMDGSKPKFEGYATDLTTEKSLTWLEGRDKEKPFFLMCQHKAPHRTFAPALRHLGALDDVEIPEPETLFDQYDNRSATLASNEMEVDRHLTWAYDLKLKKEELDGVELPSFREYGTPEYNRMNDAQREKWDAHFSPKNKSFIADHKAGKIQGKDLVRWKYQRYIRNYLETVKAVDDSVGKLLQYLDDNNLADNTIVIYSSDQGFYLGEHGWFDKRWMFEESFKMPFVARWPGKIKPGSRPEAMIQNIDYAPTFLEIAGESVPAEVQGHSLLPIFGDSSQKVRDSLYYAYYELGEHAVPQHFGVRTQSKKLFYLPETDEWQLFDLAKDPNEMTNVYDHPDYIETRSELTNEYHRLREQFDAPDYEKVK